jgi:hypothetical protein
MKILLIITIFLELIFALVAFTPFFINSEKTIQAVNQAGIQVTNNPTDENKAAWSSAKAKLDGELWIEKIAFFGAIVVLPGVQAVMIMFRLFFRRTNLQVVQN